MMPRSQRLALWCLALLLTLLLFGKGRVPTHGGEGAAFSRFTAATVTVRLAGALPSPGVYRFPKGTTVAGAINMTVPAAALPESVRGPVTRPLEDGDVLALECPAQRKLSISLNKMPTKERMLLHVRLDPDRLDEAEWALLPGIGPTLSRRIVQDRQENGDFGSVEALARVPGIGPGKLAAIRRYF